METKGLLSFLAGNFDLYRKNKLQFMQKLQSKLVIIGLEINSKIQSLRIKYEEEN